MSLHLGGTYSATCCPGSGSGASGTVVAIASAAMPTPRDRPTVRPRRCEIGDSFMSVTEFVVVAGLLRTCLSKFLLRELHLAGKSEETLPTERSFL